ncbi:MAG TPA: FmdB family zinc ribbon protein [Thermoleophilaceae bacterium]|jgi:putative FmdB family regulatory protein|nr:FmdB family transcriptional regulator [Actinomycetota bacterium]HYN49366.1 FmdB family zinc ribbon protein [Thermoleophilaceae bacterium]
MPTYEYRCERGHTFEVVQRMIEDALTSCTTCGAPVQRVFHPVAVHFKGSGFYTNDYGKNKKVTAEAGSKSESGGDSSKKSSDSGDSKKSESSKSSSSASKTSD